MPGIKRVFKLFGEYGLPKPEFQVQQGGFWVKITSTPQITPQITSKMNPPIGLKERIIEVIRIKPSVSNTGIAEALNISKNIAKEYLAKLKKEGFIKRIGPDKGGYWEITI